VLSSGAKLAWEALRLACSGSEFDPMTELDQTHLDWSTRIAGVG
jgi:hypothetical protein